MKKAAQPKRKIRTLGIELGGGKSERTAIVLLEYFQKEKKVFLVDHQAKIGAGAHRYGDEVLLEEIQKQKADRMGVNAPLGLPPCVQCSIKACPGFRDCKNPPVRWMHEEALRAKIPVSKHPTPYTQRPLDVYLRTRVQPRYDFDLFLEETLGAGRAPLALRMQYLLSRIGRKGILETDPRVALAGISRWFDLPPRILRRYRLPEDGVDYRRQILDLLQRDLSKEGVPQLFLYEAELLAFSESLSSFHALLSALMVVYGIAGLLEKPDEGFEKEWGFMAIPRSIDFSL
jgi:hypothetical protein